MFDADPALRREGRIRGASRSVVSVYRNSVASTDRAITPLVSKDTIKIVNPPDSLRSSASADHCRRWLRRGLATWVIPGVAIKLGAELRKRMMGVAARACQVAGGGYDSIKRQMRTEERRHIPLSQPPPRPTKRKIVVAHSGPAGRVLTFAEAELAVRESARRNWRPVRGVGDHPLALGPSPTGSPEGRPIAR
jgi:hypothetical protein